VTVGGAIRDTYQTTNDDKNGFDWGLYDSAGTIKTGTIHYEARGY
jgi:hypothetical protein